MNLTSGNLSENTSNSDVMLLQALLRQMGQDIPEAEAGRSYFGPATTQAVSNLQVEFGFPPTGVVDPATAIKINPTTYIATKLNADTRPIDNKTVINQVLTNDTFDLASTNVDTWVDANKTKPPLAGLTAAVVTAVTNQLKSLQRVFKITPRYDEMRLLLIADLDSANEIASLGKENFTNQAGNWPEQSDLLEFRWDPNPPLWRLYNRSNDVGGRQIAGTPATILYGTDLRVYACGTMGQLLEFSRASTTAPWQVFDRSSAFNPAPQIVGNPTALIGWTDLHVFARGVAGQLLDFYKAAASTSWQLINISALAPSPQIAGNLVAVQTDTDLHVYGRGGNGQLLDFYKAPNSAAWQVFNLATTTTVQVASDPVVVVTGSDVHLYVRGADGQLLEFYKAPSPAPWQVFDLSAAVGGVRIAGTPVAATSGVDMHVYARGVGGQLLEFYKATNAAPWQVFDNTAAAGGVQIGGNLALFFTGYEVHLYTRGTLGQLLEFYKATSSAPWQMFNHSAELGARITSDPVIVREGLTVHLFASALCRLAPAAARRLYDSAAQVAATTQALLARYVVEAANTVETQVTQGQRAAPNTLPNLAQLFGSLNYCDCDQCRSVYSPAAYLVDLLAFLKKPTVAGDRTILDLLLARRPDLNLLELSCENTNIPLPYVDLVNEVLEDAVMGRSAIRQTHGTPEELNATPEYVNDYAYTALSTAVYPQGMPFNLWTTEARVYLENLGVRRTEIMEAFCKTPSPGELTDNVIAMEYLGLTTLEAQLITGATLSTPKSSWEFWGYTSSTPNDPDTGTPLGWVTLLNRVPVFLQQSGLTYTALTELLETRWINPGAAVPVIDLQPAEAVCDDLAKVQLTNLTEPVLNKMHRFLRLWWRLGWPMRGLDRVLSAFTPADMNLTFLRQLSHVCRLSERLNVPVPALLGWWAPLETRGYATIGLPLAKSFYELLFQNKTVAKFNPTSDPFALNPARTELQNVTPTLSDQAPAIMAALGISAADFTLLTNPAAALSTLGLSTSEVTDGMLNLGNLSRLYRLASLARALGLSVRDCLIVKALTGLNPFDPAHTEDTLRFVDKVQMIRRSEFTVAELDYLLRHTPPPTTGVAPTDDQIGQSLTMLRDGMQRIKPASPTVPDPSGTVLRAKLTGLQPTINWTNSDIDTLMTMLNGSIVYTVPGITALPSGAFAVFQDARVAGQIAYNTASQTLQFVGVMTQAQKDLLRSVPPDPPPNPKLTESAPGGLEETKSGGSMLAAVASSGSTISPGGPLPLPDYDPVYTGYLHAIDTLFTLPRTFAQTRIATFVEPNEAIVQLFNSTVFPVELELSFI